MYNKQDSTGSGASVVTFSNIPLDDEPVVVGFEPAPQQDTEPTEIQVVGVQFKKGGKVYYFNPGSLTIPEGAEVIIDTARGAEYGYCAESNHSVPVGKVVQPLRPVIRIATASDKRTREEFKSRENEALELCQNKILERQLDMKLVSAEYSFDGSKILFYFTADGRVDFRELVKDLAGVFRTRIELRQIGVRDEAKMMGGLGICGRPFCCKQFLDDFQPVSIKMAKTQGLSLNPTKISGTCGRLMCCLKYEQDAYEDLIKTCPKQESIVNTCDGKGTVTEVSLLKETVKVRLDNDPSSIKTYCNCDICVLRNGKGKKNDPPIPDDIAPLPKPAAKPAAEPEEESSFFSSYSEKDSSRRTGSERQTDRGSRFNRSERTERTEKAERAEQSGRGEKGEKGEKSEKSGKSERIDKSERYDRKRRTDSDGRELSSAAAEAAGQSQGGQGKKRNSRSRRGDSRKARSGGETTGKSERFDRPEKQEKLTSVPGQTVTEKPERSEKAEKIEKSGNNRSFGRKRYYRGKKSGGGKSEQN